MRPRDFTGLRQARQLRTALRGRVPRVVDVVDEIEHIYYTWNAPSKGGPQLTSLPQTGEVPGPHARSGAWPPQIKPVFRHRLRGEGGVRKPTAPPDRAGRPCW